MRVGLDLAEAPGYWGVLSFLPGEELRSLLLGAGYRPAGYENLADTGTADPLLREWIRISTFSSPIPTTSSRAFPERAPPPERLVPTPRIGWPEPATLVPGLSG